MLDVEPLYFLPSLAARSFSVVSFDDVTYFFSAPKSNSTESYCCCTGDARRQVAGRSSAIAVADPGYGYGNDRQSKRRAF
ncbi:hypothetical protein HYQ46_006271 [Verticillium longisporum]|nr:hypothetical protein HYQ46_006271 [Verticillium longisporum]